MDRAAIDSLILSLKDKPHSGLIFLPDALTSVEHKRMVQLVARCRLAAMYPLRLFSDVGGLISYGPNLHNMYAGAASYVNRILRGANPADLPVQAPDRV